MIQTWSERTLAFLLMSSLAACGPGEQQAQIEAPVAAQPSESTMMADIEETAVPEMPEFLDMSGRFGDMFITDITDDFNPGVQVGDQFPAIRAMYKGEEITNIDQFIRDKGAIFIAARSVDW